MTIYCSQGDDHAARMARFAIAAAEVAGETLVDSGNLSSGTVKIRIGLHSGPVTACVLGQNIPKSVHIAIDIHMVLPVEVIKEQKSFQGCFLIFYVQVYSVGRYCSCC